MKSRWEKASFDHLALEQGNASNPEIAIQTRRLRLHIAETKAKLAWQTKERKALESRVKRSIDGYAAQIVPLLSIDSSSVKREKESPFAHIKSEAFSDTKAIYRRLVKKLHPDANEGHAYDFFRLSRAYREKDDVTLYALEAKYSDASAESLAAEPPVQMLERLEKEYYHLEAKLREEKAACQHIRASEEYELATYLEERARDGRNPVEEIRQSIISEIGAQKGKKELLPEEV